MTVRLRRSYLGAMKKLLGVCVGLLALLVVSPASAQITTEVTVEVTARLAEPPSEVAVSVTDGEGMASVRPVPLEQGRGRLRLALPQDARWTVSVEEPGIWSTPVAVTPAADMLSRTQPLDLWPAVSLEARLRTPLDVPAPDAVELRLVSPEITARQPETARVTCPVAEGRLAGCPVPEGTWDLRLDAGGELAPHMLWERALHGPKPVNLGTVTLRRGGSLAGSIVTEGGPFDPDAARVWVEPATRPLGDGDGGRAEQLRHPATVDKRGRFQIVGLPVGSYVLHAEHPGFVPAEMKPLAVERGVWSDLPPLVLELPLQLEVQVAPAVDVADSPWRVELWPNVEGVVESLSGTTDGLGRWLSPPARPGLYLLFVKDGEGNQFHFEELTLARGATQVEVELSLVYVEGEVVLGDEPLEATLVFGGRHGGASIETASDEAGEFSVVLPRDGNWKVDVTADDVQSAGLEVEVRPFGDDRVARVTVEVPDTRLSGRVVTVAGQSVPSPDVFALPLERPESLAMLRVGESGTFVLRGLPEAVYELEARKGDANSGKNQVDVRQGAPITVELVVRSGEPFTGRVTYDGAPVAGAWVTALPVTGDSSASLTPSEDRTGLEGRFEATVPPSARSVRLIVQAPGHPLSLLEVAPDRPAQVVLGRGAGTLVLDGMDDLGPSTGAVGLLFVDGQPIDQAFLSRWAQRQGRTPQGDTWSIPGMPPGQVAFCVVTVEEGLAIYDGRALPRTEACDQGYLPMGGELQLVVPEQ